VSSSVNNCSGSVIKTLALTLSQASKIYAFGFGAYDRDAMTLKTGELWVELYNDTSTLVASTHEAYGSDFGSDTVRIPLAPTGVLHGGGAFASNPDYVAAAGSYTLKLVASGNDGGCSGTGTIWRPSLGYMLVGS